MPFQEGVYIISTRHHSEKINKLKLMMYLTISGTTHNNGGHGGLVLYKLHGADTVEGNKKQLYGKKKEDCKKH